MKRTSSKLDKAVYWSTLITLMNESYMIIVVCVLINIKIFSWENLGLKVMSSMCSFFLFFSVFLPIIFMWTLNKNFYELKEAKLRDKYHAFFDELRLQAGKRTLLVPGFFLLRRFLLGIAICVVGRVLIWQIFIMAAQIIIQVIIIGSGTFLWREKARMEYFNEFILMQTMYTILCFSPFVPDVKTKFYLGYVTITIVCLHLAVNLFSIFKSTFHGIKFKCKKRIMKNKFKKSRL